MEVDGRVVLFKSIDIMMIGYDGLEKHTYTFFPGKSCLTFHINGQLEDTFFGDSAAEQIRKIMHDGKGRK